MVVIAIIATESRELKREIMNDYLADKLTKFKATQSNKLIKDRTLKTDGKVMEYKLKETCE